MPRLSIRWRLTLWYAGLFAAVLALFGASLFVGLRSRLYETFDDHLSTQSALVASSVRVDDSVPVLSLDPGEIDDDLFVRLLDRDSYVTEESEGDIGAVPLDQGMIADALTGDHSIASVRIDGETLRLETRPVHQGEEIVGVLQVGLSRNDVDDILDETLSLLLVAAPLMLAVAAAGGYLLAGRALTPVATITSLAARIGERQLDARLDLDLPDDELGRLAHTFNAMLARIEDAFERQRRFTADAAHELRTPVSLARSQVDLALARPRSAEEYRAALNDLDTDLGRVAGLVESLLTLTRVDTRQLVLDRGSFDLATTVGLVLEQYATVVAESGIALVNEASPTLLVADEDLVIQVMVNLLDNAIRHTPVGGVITVGCSLEGDRARLWVSDTGAGIPPEHRERVFDRFYRVDTGRTRERGGVGLGLAISRMIAEAHEGTLALAPNDIRGTRVELILPIDT